VNVHVVTINCHKLGQYELTAHRPYAVKRSIETSFKIIVQTPHPWYFILSKYLVTLYDLSNRYLPLTDKSENDVVITQVKLSAK